MRFEFPSGFLAVVISMSGFLALATDSSAQQSNRTSKSKRDETAWVKQIEPGVRLYGQVPEFAEIGQSNWFDVSADGQTIAFCGGKEVQFWDIEKKKVSHRIDLKGPALTFDYSPDGRLLVIATRSDEGAADYRPNQGEQQQTNFIGVWDAITWEKLLEINSSAGKDPVYGPQVRQQAVSPDGTVVAIGYGPKTQLFNLRTGDQICEIVHRQFVQFIAFMPDGEQLVDSLGDRFDVNTGRETGKLPGRLAPQYLSEICVHPNRNVIVAVSWDQGIAAWDLDDEQPIEIEKPKVNSREQAHQFFLAEFSNNGRYLATATYGGQGSKPARLFVWDFETGKILNRFSLKSGSPFRMRFSADSQKLFTKSIGEVGISEWKIEAERSGEAEKLFGNTSPISGFQFSPDGKTILASTNRGNSVVFDLKTGQPIDHLYAQSTSHLDGTSDGKYALLGAMYNSAVIYDWEAKKSQPVRIRSFQRASPVSRLSGLLTGRATNPYENFAINSAIMADDDQHFLIACRGPHYLRWEKFELGSGRSVAQKRLRIDNYWVVDDSQQKHLWQARTATIAPNGQWLGIVNDDDDVFVIDAESGVLLHHLEDAGGDSCKIYFTTDSSMMLVVAENSVRVWDMELGEELDPAIKLESAIAGIAISRDGDRLAVFSKAKPAVMKVFELANHTEVYSRKLKGGYSAIGISDDGQQVALAKDNSQFELLDIGELAGR